MYSSIMSAAISGLTVTDVRVETDMGDGLPLFTMVGCLSSQIREAEARVRSAFRNLRFSMPAKRITVNLSPADLPKSSSRFDLPIALTILAASGLIPEESLHGKIRGKANRYPRRARGRTAARRKQKSG